MSITETISLDAIPKIFIVPNIENPMVHIVTPEESGYDSIQVFAQNTFAQNISSQFIGLSKTEDGNAHPTYVSEISLEDLFLEKFNGYNNGPDILDTICKKTFSREGFLSARSIKESDLRFFDYQKENLIYWVANNFKKDNSFYMRAISNGENKLCNINNLHHLPIRAIFTLDCIVTNIGNYNSWIEI